MNSNKAVKHNIANIARGVSLSKISPASNISKPVVHWLRMCRVGSCLFGNCLKMYQTFNKYWILIDLKLNFLTILY